ncbi:hypothetical protein OG599_08980 [Streptomyces sp. NBC_01335]|uniref:hypothetical protein n=1 Tax=Streptomyces sp. NBC_01335 TaxID=2903828 RepID=UPI002E10AF08|nr:hypothetical protein OG599_08980 [Streptomyces sp. NBC_01335]
MTLYHDGLVKIVGSVGSLAVTGTGVYLISHEPNTQTLGLSLVGVGASFAWIVGRFQDTVRSNDARVVAHLAHHPDADLPSICKATGLSDEHVASSLQHLGADGLVNGDRATPPSTCRYHLV